MMVQHLLPTVVVFDQRRCKIWRQDIGNSGGSVATRAKVSRGRNSRGELLHIVLSLYTFVRGPSLDFNEYYRVEIMAVICKELASKLLDTKGEGEEHHAKYTLLPRREMNKVAVKSLLKPLNLEGIEAIHPKSNR